MNFPKTQNANARLESLDTYRGFIMLCMISAGLGVKTVAERLAAQGNPSNILNFLGHQLSHSAWIGCTFWDLIQPGFIFIVGVAIPYSMRKRLAQGTSLTTLYMHAAKRSLILIAIGIFLSFDLIQSRPSFNWHLYNVLTQIGLAYIFAVTLSMASVKTQLAASLLILLAYWLLFALYPISPESIRHLHDAATIRQNFEPTFFQHWDKNANVAFYFDRYFINLWPRPEEYSYSKGGYTTLNFIPSIVTMLMGVMTGKYLQKALPSKKTFFIFVSIGLGCVIFGYALGQSVSPIIKRLWTPSWTLFSGGWVLIGLSIFILVIDVYKFRKWITPFVVVGKNPLTIYVLSMIFSDPAAYAFNKILLPNWTFQPLLSWSLIVFGLWFIAYIMDKRKIYIRI